MRIREVDAALSEKKRIRQQAVLAFTNRGERRRLIIEFRETLIIRPFKPTKPGKSPPHTPLLITPPGRPNITLLHIPSASPDFAVPRITLPAHENPPVLGGCVCTVFGTTRGESQSGPGEGYPGCDEGETKEWGCGWGILFAWVIKGNGFTDYNDCTVLTYLHPHAYPV